MCGIAGIYSLEGKAVARERVRRMTDAMVYRGPDDSGFFEEGALGMGMRRLSIIDLDGGRQPISNEDGSVTVVFNGEIYNYRELRDDLEKKGHSFTTDSDTETIVHLFEDHGARAAHFLNGQFAIAVWESRAARLTLIRDRLGLKPLYYARSGDELLFGSEIKCLIAAGGASKTIDPAALDAYFTTQYFPLERTLLRDARKLLPGHVMTVENGKIAVEQYWDVKFPSEKSTLSEEDAIERFRELFFDAVRRRLVADVPLGAFLSGGIDSSAVVAVMAGMTDEPVKTFSIGFGREAKSFNELDHARAVSRAFGADAREWVIRPGDVLDRVETVLDHFDQPFGGGLHTFLVSELAAGEVKVALSGIGVDEMLGGYERQKKARWLASWARLPESAKRVFRTGASAFGHVPGGRVLADKFKKMDVLSSSSPRGLYFDWIAVFDDPLKRRLYTREFQEAIGGFNLPDFVFDSFGDGVPSDLDDVISYLELKTTLPDDFLNYTDSMSMAWSLEARAPFLDHTLVEFAASLPISLKIKNGSTKYILKKAMKGIVPDEIINRKKQPFFLPLGLWFRKELRPLVEDLLMSDELRSAGYVKKSVVREIVQQHLAGQADYTWHIWSLMLFEQWSRKNA